MEKLCKIHEENQEKAFKTGRATKRPFFYYRPQNFKMFLLSLSAFEFGDTKDFILKKINLTGLDKFSIEILEPVWNEKRASSSDFWGLDGVNRDFCDRLDEFADDKSVNKSDSLIKYSFNSIEKLYDIKNYIGEKEIFESLDMLFFQGMLGEISLSLKKNDQIIDAEALSEDEKQIIAIRGINDLNKFLNLNEGNLKKAREAIYTTVARKTISDLKLLLDRKAKNDYLNKQINGWLQAKDGKYREYCMVAVWYLQSKIR